MADSGVWFECEGPVFWAYARGDYSDEEFEGYLVGMERAVLAPGFGGAMLTIGDSPRMPKAVQRRSLAALSSRIAKDRLHWHAVSSDSRVARGLVTALNWLTRKPFEERIFESPALALAWLSQHNDIAGDTLWARIREVVPGVPPL